MATDAQSANITELATRYSEACTRSGVAALVVAALAFSFTQRLAKVEALEAFGSYVLARELLDASIEGLTTSDFWSTTASALKRDPSESERITIGELATIECVMSSDKGRYARKRVALNPTHQRRWDWNPIATALAQASPTPRDKSAPQTPSNVGVIPAAPSAPRLDLAVTEPCPGLEDLSNALARLWDEPKIELARTYSNDTNIELYRWQLKRNHVAGRISITDGTGDRFSRLDIVSLRQLNQTPRTTVQQFSMLVRERMIVTGPYSPDSQSVNVAAILSELAILVLATYFFLHYRAAQRAGVLSAAGSLFDTLWAHWLGRVFYLAMLLVPAMAALHLALNMSGFDRTIALTLAIGSGLLTVSLAVSFIEGFLARLDWDWLRASRWLPRRRRSRGNEKDEGR